MRYFVFFARGGKSFFGKKALGFAQKRFVQRFTSTRCDGHERGVEKKILLAVESRGLAEEALLSSRHTRHANKARQVQERGFEGGRGGGG